MRLTAGLILAALAIVPATSTIAGPASERVFSRTALDAVAEGQAVVYTHVREGTVGEALQPLPDGEIHVQVVPDTTGALEARVTMGSAGKLRPVSTWPVSSGNPILPIFLESALRTMARATGGSAFYIRNRIKEALGSGGTMTPVTLSRDGADVSATEIVFAPFDGDRNRDRMGDFKDLKLTFVVSEAMPGDIIRFTAATGPEGPDAAYREEIAFASVETVK